MSKTIGQQASAVVRRWMPHGPETWDAIADAAASELAESHLLAPELPKPDRDGRWWPTAQTPGNVTARGGNVQMWSGVWGQWNATPDQARDLARILDAAAALAESEEG